MARKGMKDIHVSEELHSKLSHLKIDKKLPKIGDTVQWMYDALKQLGKV